MKSNTIVLKGKNGKKTKYRVVLAVHGESALENLVLYTNDVVKKNGEVDVYAVKININGEYKKVTKKEFSFLNGMLKSLQSEGKKDEK